MPRSRGYKVTRRKKKQYGRKVLNTAEHALRVANQVKKLLNVEYKQITISETTTTPDSTGEVISLNHCGVGDNSGSREGISVLMKSLNFKYYAEQHASATNTFIRIMLVLDRAPNSTVATISDILDESKITSNLEITNSHRFRVLSERLVSLNSSSHDNSISKIYKTLDFHTKYDGTGSTANDIMANQLLLVMLSNEATNTPSVHYSTRVRFIDN